MKKLFLTILICLAANAFYSARAQDSSNAKWITSADNEVNSPNTWIAFRKDINLKSVPKSAVAKIAVDSKYWLWVNGELAVFEGGLKRGPNPNDTYYDEVELGPYLKKGENKIAVLLWYFGKEGFSHKDSGKAGMLFDLQAKGLECLSGSDWISKIHPAYQTAGDPQPNFRLPESNILYIADKEMAGWQTADCSKEFSFRPSIEIGTWGSAPWNALHKRPIPQWKDHGIKTADKVEYKRGDEIDSVIVRLPYNMQMTPIFEVDDPTGGNMIGIYTDHFYAGGAVNLRGEYITKKGNQEYESLGWLNGDSLIIVTKPGVTIKNIRYRETGYNSDPIGKFECDDEFIMKFWEKALRTLYVNMRDTYYDCPDRERSQWWGDVVLLSGESFYTYSPSIHKLTRKGMYELMNWQKPNGVIFSPIPAGNWEQELPGQMLASVGKFGFWNYYMNTGDKEAIEDLYPRIKRYLDVWSLDDTGLTAFRMGDWTWGDWGDNIDKTLLFAGFHHLALDAASQMADLIGKPDDARQFRAIMGKVKEGYNKCWNGYAYRHPSYHGETDDRVQAIAVLAGIAGTEKYETISRLLKQQLHASPYMEKYVMESLFVMGESEYAMERMKKRYNFMVNFPEYTTLFEGWDIGMQAFGGGTVNHAWSGGPLTVIAQYVCGIYPLEAGYGTFKIEPDPATFNNVSITVPSVAGEITSGFVKEGDKITMNITVPKGTTAVVYMPTGYDQVETLNGKPLKENQYTVSDQWVKGGKKSLQLPAGNYTIVAR